MLRLTSMKEKFLWHYRKSALPCEFQGRSLLLYTSFLSVGCDTDTRTAIFCRSFDSLVVDAAENLRGVTCLYDRSHWGDAVFFLPEKGLLEVQVVDSMSSTGEFCVGVEQQKKCLIEVIFYLYCSIQTGTGEN